MKGSKKGRFAKYSSIRKKRTGSSAPAPTSTQIAQAVATSPRGHATSPNPESMSKLSTRTGLAPRREAPRAPEDSSPSPKPAPPPISPRKDRRTQTAPASAIQAVAITPRGVKPPRDDTDATNNKKELTRTSATPSMSQYKEETKKEESPVPAREDSTPVEPITSGDPTTLELSSKEEIEPLVGMPLRSSSSPESKPLRTMSPRADRPLTRRLLVDVIHSQKLASKPRQFAVLKEDVVRTTWPKTSGTLLGPLSAGDTVEVIYKPFACQSGWLVQAADGRAGTLSAGILREISENEASEWSQRAEKQPKGEKKNRRLLGGLMGAKKEKDAP